MQQSWHYDGGTIPAEPRQQHIQTAAGSSDFARRYFWSDKVTLDVIWDRKIMHHESFFRTKWDAGTAFLLFYLALVLPAVLAYDIEGPINDFMSTFQTVSIKSLIGPSMPKVSAGWHGRAHRDLALTPLLPVPRCGSSSTWPLTSSRRTRTRSSASSSPTAR
jgi:hypothetical protein